MRIHLAAVTLCIIMMASALQSQDKDRLVVLPQKAAQEIRHLVPGRGWQSLTPHGRLQKQTSKICRIFRKQRVQMESETCALSIRKLTIGNTLDYICQTEKIVRSRLTSHLLHRFNSTMSMFSGSIYIGVRNLNAAIAWYIDKFELTKSKKPIDEEIGDVALVSNDGKIFIAMGAPNPANVETRIFNVKKIEKAREWIESRGISMGPLLTDGQNQYFEIRDLENNMIEICQEH